MTLRKLFLKALAGKADVLDPSEVDLASCNSILVIRQHDMLGDFLLATPVFQALRKSFPQARIGVVVREYQMDCVVNNPYVDEILLFYRQNHRWTPSKLYSFWKQIRKRWDMAIVLNTVSHSITSDLIASFSGARYVAGSEFPSLTGFDSPIFYNIISGYAKEFRHQTDRNLDIVRPLGVDAISRNEQMFLSSDEEEAALHELQKSGIKKDKKRIELHLGAGKIKNRWPVKSFASLAARLQGEKDAQILIFWGEQESELEKEFSRLIDFDVVRVPPGGIRDLAARFRMCGAVVCNDTGVMHICASVGVPLVAVFGPTDPEEWKPIGSQFIAVRGRDNTTESVAVDEVY
ncbi:MAG: glycosyltransferase family 9 protein, partial [bacterium]